MAQRCVFNPNWLVMGYLAEEIYFTGKKGLEPLPSGVGRDQYLGVFGYEYSERWRTEELRY